jgi:endonuclease-3
MNKDIEFIINYLKEVWKDYESPLKSNIHLKGNDPFQILISTILSTRTKDEITYPTAKKLFEIYKNPEDFIKISTEELERLIYPIGFYKTKAKSIKKIAEIIIREYNNKVPDEFEELIKLPNVGRKVANLVLSVAYGKDVICVDTHVHRISNRIGLVRAKTPTETEFKLMEVVPRKYWREINYLMVGFGQVICKPTKPKCDVCRLKAICDYFKKH